MSEETIPQETPVEFSATEKSALEQGWVPKEDFNGEEHKWVEAGEFLRRGELFGKIDSQKRELKETKKIVQALEQHYLQVKETEYKRALADLKKQKKDALIENDVEAVLDVDEKIGELKDEQIKQARTAAQSSVEAPAPHPEFVAWANKNSWYQTDKAMTAYADAFGNDLQAEGKSPSEVLRLVGEEVRKKFTDKFYNPNRDKASPVEGSSTQKSGGSTNKLVLTEIEATVMKKLVGQGVLTKEQYLSDIKVQRERS